MISSGQLRSIILTLFFLAGFHPALFSQINYTVADGMSDNNVNVIFQDSYGFIWIGTRNGLTRFDGYEFVNYESDSSERSLSDNVIKDIAEDSGHNLWISTHNGLSEYIRSQNIFRKHFNVKDDNNSLQNNLLFDVEMKGDSLLISSWMGLSVLSLKDRKFTNLNLNKNNITQNQVDGLMVLHGDIWACNSFELIRISSGLDVMARYPIPVADSGGRISGINYTGSDKIFVSTWLNRAFVFDTRTGSFSGIDSPEWINSAFVSDSLVYLATNEGVFYSKITKQDWFNNLTKVTSYSGDDYVTCVFYDRQGNLWIGTRNDGVYKLKHPQNLFKTVDLSLPGKDFSNLKNIYADKLDNIYCASPKSFVCFNLKNLSRDNRAIPEDLNFYPNLFQDDELNYWYSKDNKLIEINYKTGEQHTISQDLKNARSNNQFRSIFQIDEVIIGIRENSILKYNKKNRPLA